MNELQELRLRFDAMRANFDAGFTGKEREEIARQSVRLLNKPVRKSGCRDCYRDAYVEVVKKLGELVEMPKLPDYILKAGVVYQVPCGNKVYTGANIPSEVAEKWLKINPSAIRFFQRFPEDWRTRIEEPANGSVVEKVENVENGDPQKPKTKTKKSKK